MGNYSMSSESISKPYSYDFTFTIITVTTCYSKNNLVSIQKMTK